MTSVLDLLPFPCPGGDTKRLFAEYVLLGGMLKADEQCLRSGANVDWSHPMSEAIARACVEAWEQHGAETDEAWRCACGAYLARYTGRSPLRDSAMLAWVGYLIAFYEIHVSRKTEGNDDETTNEGGLV